MADWLTDDPAPVPDAGEVRLNAVAADLYGYLSWRPDPGTDEFGEDWAMLRDSLLARLGLTAADQAAWQHCWATYGGGTDPNASLLLRLHEAARCVADLRDEGRVPSGSPGHQMTVRDALGWICATSPTGNPSVYRALPPYAHLPFGWVYFAAGISPTEAAATTIETALAMAALRGTILPPVPTAATATSAMASTGQSCPASRVP